jgi:hypothetical protein
MAVNSTDIDSTPGYMNVLKSTPGVLPGHPRGPRGGVREGAQGLRLSVALHQVGDPDGGLGH